jgi:hypothetical protein|tara:strand:+ start:1269 stop:2726 length:1458 start_codon:yes stop_codon:yes gene_type:complete
MSTTRQRVEIYWGDQPPGLEEMASPAPTGEMIFNPVDVGMLGRASGSREPGVLPGIGRASAVHGSNVAAIASATGQSESSVQQNLGDISMPTVGGDRGFDARSNRIAHHTNVLQQNRVIKSSTGPWSAFDVYGSGGYSYGGDDEGGDEGGAGEGETRPDIALPPHVETTGKNTKEYEIMMLTNLDQRGIRLWAEEHGFSYEDAIDQLFAEFVPAEWKSPWEQHLEMSGFAEGTSLEEAWTQIGLDPTSVELYEGPEGTRDHWEHDWSQSFTTLTFGEWSLERLMLEPDDAADDDLFVAPVSDEGYDLALALLDLTEALEAGTEKEWIAQNPELFERMGQMPDGTPAIQTGPTQDTVSQDTEEPVTETTSQESAEESQTVEPKFNQYQMDIAASHGYFGDNAYADFLEGWEDPEPEEDAPASNQYEEQYKEWVDKINETSPVNEYFGEMPGQEEETGWAGMDEKEKQRKRGEHWEMMEQANMAEGW